MLFNSLDFALFLPVVFILYWFVFNRNLRWQNAFIVVASYVFYAWWDWRFLSLIIISTVVDYAVGLLLKQTNIKRQRKFLLAISIVVNLGLLGFFKYYNFFILNFTQAFSFFGNDISPGTLNIILPAGISFYTFQTMSYTIDVYRKKLDPTSDIIKFAAFVSFFPQLVAGPIEKASRLLPQIGTPRTFNYAKATDGLRQILWGLFKKVVIADNCGHYANIAFDQPEIYGGSTLLIGAIFFTIQVYGDFSGYSDIAIGTARLFGINLMRNFNSPYFSRDIAEFWRRWHISLSTWFRDYLYIPLGGSRGGTWIKVRNIFIIFIVSGFWHGASWTFVVWGALHALYFLPLLLTNSNRKNLDTVAEGKMLPNFQELMSMALTFAFTVFSLTVFRSQSLYHAYIYLSELFSYSLFSEPQFPDMRAAFVVVILTIIFMIIEWFGREGPYALEPLIKNRSKIQRYGSYYALVFAILWFGEKEEQFIYFQF